MGKKKKIGHAPPMIRTLIFALLLLVAIPLTIFLTRQKQTVSGHAASANTYPSTDGNILWTGDWSSGTTNPWELHTGGEWGNSSAEVVTSPVKWGNYSGKLTLNPGSGNVRAEITSSQDDTGGYPGQDWYYSFSIYFPSDPDKASGWGTATDDWSDFTQWMDMRANCSPPLQFIVDHNSEIQFHYELDSQNSGNCGYGSYPTHDYDVGPIVYDQWIDFTAHIKWSEDASVGYVQVWRNGQEVLPQTYVQTLDPGSSGVYMEQAVYRPNPSGVTIEYLSGTRRHDAFTPEATSSITPVTSVTPTGTTTGGPGIALTICPHGIGNCGDNANPGIGGNTNPQHTTRNVTVTAMDNNNNPVATGQGTMTYNSSGGNFQGNISMGSIPNGSYLIKVQSPGLLASQSPGIITLSSGQRATLPALSLITGDVNTDDQLDILDYNAIVSCYGTKQSTVTCTTSPTASTTGSDINDDGKVDAVDYNLFIRELSVQKGK